MLRMMVALGTVMAVGSGGLAFDYTQQAGNMQGQQLDMSAYLAGPQGRVVNLMEPTIKQDSRQANVPQISRRTTQSISTASMDLLDSGWSGMSNEEQIADFIGDSPQLQDMIKDQKEASRQGFWASVRQKLSGDEKAGQRQSDIRKRNTLLAGPKYSMDEIACMNQGELIANMSQIRRDIPQQAIANMNGVIGAIEKSGMDLSDYQNTPTLDMPSIFGN